MLNTIIIALSISAQPLSNAQVETFIDQIIPASAVEKLDQLESEGMQFAPITEATLHNAENARFDGWCASELIDLSINLSAYLARHRDTDLSSLSRREQTLIRRAAILLMKVEAALENFPVDEGFH